MDNISSFTVADSLLGELWLGCDHKPTLLRVFDEGLTHLLVCELRGFAPRYARFTLAFLPSMMGFASLQARSAAPLSTMVTC